jgi:hypothetical protein
MPWPQDRSWQAPARVLTAVSCRLTISMTHLFVLGSAGRLPKVRRRLSARSAVTPGASGLGATSCERCASSGRKAASGFSASAAARAYECSNSRSWRTVAQPKALPVHLHGIDSVVNVKMSAAHQHLLRRLLLPLTVSHPDSGSPSQSAGNHAMVCVAATRLMPGPRTRKVGAKNP